MPALVPEVPAAMLHSVLGGSRRGSALQAAVGNLHWNLLHIRGRLRDPAADGDPITSAIEDVLGQAEPPGDEEAVTACLLCRTIGPCLSVECPRTHIRVNVATWLRAARTMATAPDNVFNCPFCEQSCAGWGQHLLAACGKVALAVQAGFSALVLAAAPGATVPEWVTTTWVRLGRPSGDSLHLVLRADHEVTATWPPARPHTVYVTWSGMLMGTCAEASRWLTAARRDSLASAYLEALATYARSAAWDLFWTTSNGPVSGWTHGLSWQHAACLSALLHLYDRAVTALAESPGLGVAALAEPEFPLGSDGQHCSVLVVIGGGQAPAWEGAAVHRWSLARLDAQPEHVHVRVGDRFWMSAPEGTVPQGLAEALMALSAVVPGSSTVVRARGDPDAPPGGSGPAASE